MALDDTKHILRVLWIDLLPECDRDSRIHRDPGRNLAIDIVVGLQLPSVQLGSNHGHLNAVDIVDGAVKVVLKVVCQVLTGNESTKGCDWLLYVQ
jgi:hypothetical protein